MSHRPFEPESQTGLELELLAPKGRSRHDLARALAKAWSGRVLFGLKYSSEGLHRDARPICTLTPSYQIEVEGEVRASLVDDTTIQNQLEPSKNTPPELFRVVMDDLRLALWLQRKAQAEAEDAEALLGVMLETFDATLGAPGEGTESEAHRAIIDPYGHPLAVVAPYPGERERVTEVVTAPLKAGERQEALETIIAQASALDFIVPEEAAFHIHLDAGPWQQTAALTGLIKAYTKDRDRLHKRWGTNDKCRRLGAFSETILRVANESPPDLPFSILAAALEMGGATKNSDLNLLGVIQPRPTQPTLEVRALPMTMDAEQLLGLIDEVEKYLLKVWA